MLAQPTLERIRRWETDPYPVLSVFLNMSPAPQETRSVRARLLEMLRPIEATIATRDRAAASSLRADIDSVLAYEEKMAGDLGHGMAIFACHGRDLFEYMSLPRTIWDIAVVDTKPYVRPLFAILSDSRAGLAVVVDRQWAQIFEFYAGEVRAHEETVVEGKRKKNFGGWYGLAEYGARRHAEELAHRHYRETVAVISDLAGKGSFELLFIGGHRGTIDEFMPFLTPELQKRLAGTFVIDPNTMTPKIVQQHCADLEEAYERGQLDQLVSRLLDAAAGNGSAVLGLQRVLDAVNANAIDLLVLRDVSTESGVGCDACGWLGIGGSTCPLCAATLRHVPDLIGQLIETVIDRGGKAKRVLDPSPLTEPVAAMLRFPVPRRREKT